MNILLAYHSGLPNRNDPYMSLVPTGLCYLHACLREAGHHSTLANFSAWSEKKIRSMLTSLKPGLIGISQWTHNRHASLRLAEICRSLCPDCIIIMGGAHATFCYDDILAEGSPVDAVIRGESETALLEFVKRLKNNMDWRDIPGMAYRYCDSVAAMPLGNRLERLDDLPMPARYLDYSTGLDLELQSEFLITSRGCPSSCNFCSSPDFWGRKVRFRKPEAIIEEILYIRDKFGLIYFSIRDDTFTADRNRVMEFCSQLQKQEINILWNCQSRVTAIDKGLVTAMKLAGCECIQLGVESGSPEILKRLGKEITPAQIEHACSLIRDAGIHLSVYLISDVPGETADDIRLTLELLSRINADDGYVSQLAYYPGTRFYRSAVQHGTTTPGIFASHKAALYASDTAGSSTALLLSRLTECRQTDPGRFKRQKTMIGYCYATNAAASEWHRQRGEYVEAEKELLEITTNQPGNPWGWFLLGDLYCEMGRAGKARESYSRVLGIVPQHGPSKSALYSGNKKAGSLS